MPAGESEEWPSRDGHWKSLRDEDRRLGHDETRQRRRRGEEYVEWILASGCKNSRVTSQVTVSTWFGFRTGLNTWGPASYIQLQTRTLDLGGRTGNSNTQNTVFSRAITRKLCRRKRERETSRSQARRIESTLRAAVSQRYRSPQIHHEPGGHWKFYRAESRRQCKLRVIFNPFRSRGYIHLRFWTIDRYDCLRQNTRDSDGLISGTIVSERNGLKVHNPKRILRNVIADRGWIQFRASLKLIADTGTKYLRLLQDYAYTIRCTVPYYIP